jgi:hypothetical protein
MLGKTKLVVAGVLVLVLLAAGIGGTIAFAQGPTPTGNTWMDMYLQTLAQKLGTTVEKLQQAMTDARKEAATQGVKQGLLTQSQADRMLGTTAGASIANAGLEAAAKTLGMSTADLTTALQSKTLLTLAQEKNVDVTKLRTAIADAQKASIDQAVKDGKLTQAQADSLKADLKPENVDLNQRSFGWGGRGALGGFDGWGGPGGISGPGGMGGPFGGRFGRR